MKKLLLFSFLLSGCTWQGFGPEPQPVVAPEPVVQEPVISSAGLSSIATRDQIYDPVSEAVAELAIQLQDGLQMNRVRRLPMAVMPFVDLSRARERYNGALGERLGESFVYQLQQNEYNLIDYRAVSLLTTARDPLTKQNMSSLRNRFRIYFLLTGTYARYPDGIVVNARVLDTTTRQVLASGQTHLPDSRLEGGTPGYDPIKAMQKGMIIENSLGPVGQ
ncbi:FlgO family outer membrane protein [Pontibacterium granulatum]|uniref:FlgO family outer membrane protein n=1 Tax=Pontibacterium granulatum TaxID=2036029 RepID=UPI00249A3991|nr:FlgO family outer membrane protein [Pontibacterium granulatum]MDI3322971.1 FlgO family outer membrane protein [Pontibacterium granulatum]